MRSIARRLNSLELRLGCRASNEHLSGAKEMLLAEINRVAARLGSGGLLPPSQSLDVVRQQIDERLRTITLRSEERVR